MVLRFGRFYAADSDQALALVQSARRGVLLDVGSEEIYSPMIDADDAAAAVVAALAAPSGTYDVVDEPTTRLEQTATLASAVGRRRLLHAPRWFRPTKATFLAASQRVSNTAFRDATGWRPSSPTVREGYAKMTRELRVDPALPGLHPTHVVVARGDRDSCSVCRRSSRRVRSTTTSRSAGAGSRWTAATTST